LPDCPSVGVSKKAKSPGVDGAHPYGVRRSGE
jgi:hypothetical protein